MKLLKLDATDSTNDYLKQLSSKEIVENFTIIVAKSQTKGKGQMGAVWKSQSGKNLTFSILIKNSLENSNQIFDCSSCNSNYSSFRNF
jgi:BirA family transcriptional regulator, biotin operon repressor / biotin---[acetyl-CoA-carboxylase] ligase